MAHTIVASVPSAPAAADAPASSGPSSEASAQKRITLTQNGVTTIVDTSAATVGDLLIERGIAPALGDRLTPDSATLLGDGASVEFRAAIPVTLLVGNERRSVRTTARTIGEVLAEAGVTLASHDKVFPASADSFSPDAVIRVTRRLAWQERIRSALVPHVRKVYAYGLPRGQHKVITAGIPGMRETTYAYAQETSALSPTRSKIASRILRPAREMVIAEGISEYEASERLVKRGMDATLRLTSAALSMIATAYTANCFGCSGRAALGMRAGHGIVAVDPRFIRLGSHLYIPGYGHAIAGDTGGSIVGNRIDLGFESNRDALVFGRRSISVYVLK